MSSNWFWNKWEYETTFPVKSKIRSFFRSIFRCVVFLVMIAVTAYMCYAVGVLIVAGYGSDVPLVVGSYIVTVYTYIAVKGAVKWQIAKSTDRP